MSKSRASDSWKIKKRIWFGRTTYFIALTLWSSLLFIFLECEKDLHSSVDVLYCDRNPENRVKQCVNCPINGICEDQSSVRCIGNTVLYNHNCIPENKIHILKENMINNLWKKLSNDNGLSKLKGNKIYKSYLKES